MRYSPEIHHRRSIRLPGYDYASHGYYFATVCTAARELILNNDDCAAAVSQAWFELAVRFPGLDLDEFILMPNHVHGIVILAQRPGQTPILGNVMRAFKSTSAIAVNRVLGRSGRPVWQRDYYERIIRNERELLATREYIQANPANWNADPNNPALSPGRDVRKGAASGAPTGTWSRVSPEIPTL